MVNEPGAPETASAPGAAYQPGEPWKDQGDDTARLVFFSDAVFAVALTLLVFGLRLPVGVRSRDLVSALAIQVGPSLVALLITFVVISSFWRVHHRIFTQIARYDSALITINFIFLLGIVLQPFTTQLLSFYGDTAIAVALYALLLGVTMALLTAIEAYAAYARLGRAPGGRTGFSRHHALLTLVPALIFLVTGGLAFVMRPGWVPFLWLLIIPAHRILVWALARQGKAGASARAKG